MVTDSFLIRYKMNTKYKIGSSGGVLVRALASHRCGPDSIPGSGVICGLSLLVLYSTLLREVFPRVLQFSPLTKNQHLIWFVLVWPPVSPISMIIWCVKAVVLVFAMDSESRNKAANNLLEEKKNDNTIGPYLALSQCLPDPVHAGKEMSQQFSNRY